MYLLFKICYLSFFLVRGCLEKVEVIINCWFFYLSFFRVLVYVSLIVWKKDKFLNFERLMFLFVSVLDFYKIKIKVKL